MQIAGIGRFIFWDGGSLWIGLAAAAGERHAHHAIQLSLGLSGAVQFRPDASSPWTRYAAALIPSDLPHVFQAPGNQVAQIFVEPESTTGGKLLQRFGTDAIAALDEDEARRLAAPLAAQYNDGADDETLAATATQTLARLAGDAGPLQRTTDARIVAAIEEIWCRLDEPLTLAEIARVVGLSEGRLRHLFVEQTGVPFRAYVLWARLNRALGLGYTGTSWTEAAHAANFADSAHLTRTCRRMFGLAPTALRLDHTLQSSRMLA